MVRRSAPASSRWEAQLCLRLWGERRLVMPALWAACRQANQTGLGLMGTSARTPFTVPGNRKVVGLHPAPVDAQSLQQLGAQRNLAVAAALALVNANHHALTVDVLYLQPA